jgi:hypothetical protein
MVEDGSNSKSLCIAWPDEGGPRYISIVKVLEVDSEDDGVFVSVVTSIGVSGHSPVESIIPSYDFEVDRLPTGGRHKSLN